MSEPSFKEVADQALGFAELIGFFLPGEGYVLSLGAAGTRTLIDLFWDEGAGKVSPLEQMGSAIVEALVYLRKQLSEDTWRMFEAEHLAQLKALGDWYAFTFNAVIDGAARRSEGDGVVARDWRDALQDTKAECSANSATVGVMAWILQPANHDHRHLLTPVYLLAAALQLNYCQLGLLIETELLAAAHDREYAAWKQRNPDGVESAEDPRPKRPPADGKQLTDSLFLQLLRTRSKEYAGEAARRIEAMAEDFRALTEAARKRAEDFSLVKDSAGGFRVLDREHPERRCVSLSTRPSAELALATARARAVEEVLEGEASRTGGLQRMDEEGLGSLRRALVRIERTRDSLAPPRRG